MNGTAPRTAAGSSSTGRQAICSASDQSLSPGTGPIHSSPSRALAKKSASSGPAVSRRYSVASPSADSTSTAPSAWQPVSQTKSLSARNW